MSVRKEVQELVALGPLPSVDASEEVIAVHQRHLHQIRRPVTDEEAALLVASFGPDDCYGLAWTLLHLIESAPGGSPLKSPPANADNEWLRQIWERSHRVGNSS